MLPTSASQTPLLSQARRAADRMRRTRRRRHEVQRRPKYLVEQSANKRKNVEKRRSKNQSSAPASLPDPPPSARPRRPTKTGEPLPWADREGNRDEARGEWPAGGVVVDGSIGWFCKDGFSSVLKFGYFTSAVLCMSPTLPPTQFALTPNAHGITGEHGDVNDAGIRRRRNVPQRLARPGQRGFDQGMYAGQAQGGCG